MTEVLLVAYVRPPLGVLADAVRKFNAQGARVHLAGMFDLDAEGVPEELAAIGLASTYQLPRTLKHRSQALRRRLGKSPRGLRNWTQIKGDRWLRSHGRKADVLVALDVATVYTVWRLAEYNHTAAARFGLAPALKAVEELQAKGGVTQRRSSVLPPLHAVTRGMKHKVDQLPAQIVRTATPRSLMRSGVGARLWRSAVTAPGMPIRVRAATSRYVAEGMQWAGRTSGAALTLADAAAKISDPQMRADLYYEGCMQELRKGISPRNLGKTVAAQLANADSLFAEGKTDESAEAINRALFLHFHRVLHIDQLSSPLAKDAEGFVAPLHRSKAFQALSRPRGRKAPAAPAPTDRPLRLLVTTSANDNFLHLVKEHFADHPGIELRYLDLAANKHLHRISWAAPRMLKDRLADGASDYQEEVERLMRPHLDWADTVFLEWAAGPASMLTTIDPGDTRIVVRLHSYEAFTRWPHMTDFSRIDDLIFVAPHVKDLTATLVPMLRGEHAPEFHLIDNAMDLSGFNRTKPAEARFNLGLVGISQVAKDPKWALDVLERVRKHDERYRLLLVGGDMDPKTSQATRLYLNEFEELLAPLEESGAVVRLGPTDDVPSKLVEIGTILSSSVREGCHVGLMEGAASGAVPVVRDWPFYAGKPNSARTLYPEGWVVSSPAEAAERILKVTATEESWRGAGELATEHALTVWDWPVVQKHFEKLFIEDN
ncbi:glycosyltransferase family 1 protein [Streptomyces soliscabiei]|uniref:glycosyltransferase family 1 protein n=1 Tax=Streptomyces soliscabiei TaxID=588897 RepID=UPI0029A38E60|nr:glycosyltransferase family 1 protein [Streptomyces sp. NY05-11A]MDX2676800.1 glycosyltransferase family 1 protein [Streptomyces sp. NY05-11A]